MRRIHIDFGDSLLEVSEVWTDVVSHEGSTIVDQWGETFNLDEAVSWEYL